MVPLENSSLLYSPKNSSDKMNMKHQALKFGLKLLQLLGILSKLLRKLVISMK